MSTRTRIACGWLVGHADGHHTLWRNAELVYEGNAVLFVGERFDGRGRPRDRCARQAGGARFHRHPCAFRPSRLAPADLRHRPRRLFRPAVPRDQRRPRGHARRRRSALCPPRRQCGRPRSCCSMRASRSRSCCATASRHSSSSAASCASSRRCSMSSASSASGPISARASTAAAGSAATAASSSAWSTRPRASANSTLALDFIERHQGAHDDRVRGILVPREIETCTVAADAQGRQGRAGTRPAGRDPRRLQHPRGVRHHPRASDDVGRAACATSA